MILIHYGKSQRRVTFSEIMIKKVIQKSGWIFTANQQTQTLKENCK